MKRSSCFIYCCFLSMLILSARASLAQGRAEGLKDAKFGAMTYFLPDCLSQTEHIKIDVMEWNRIVNHFNVKVLADQVESVGASYMIFSIGQNSGYYTAPNPVYDRMTGITPSLCSSRDLIADISDALHRKGIKLIVYLPSGAPIGDKRVKEMLEWQNGPYLNKAFQGKWEQIISEWSVRWGNRVDGWWFNGCYWPNIMYRNESAPNFKTFATAARAGNSKSIVAFNTGVMYRLIGITPYEDYIAGEINKTDLVSINHPFAGKIDGEQIHVLSFLGEKWGMGSPRFTDEQVVLYTKNILDVNGL